MSSKVLCKSENNPALVIEEENKEEIDDEFKSIEVEKRLEN